MICAPYNSEAHISKLPLKLINSHLKVGIFPAASLCMVSIQFTSSPHDARKVFQSYFLWIFTVIDISQDCRSNAAFVL
jgi:hypothetical protein